MNVIKPHDVGKALIVTVAVVAAAAVFPQLSRFIFIALVLLLIPYVFWRAMASGPAGDRGAPVVRVTRPESHDGADQWGSLQGTTVTQLAIAPELAATLREGDELDLVREPGGAVVALYERARGARLGVVGSGFGPALAAAMDGGGAYHAKVERVTEAGGVRVAIWNDGALGR